MSSNRQKVGIFVLQSRTQALLIDYEKPAQNDGSLVVFGDARANPQILPNQLRNVAHGVGAAKPGMQPVGEFGDFGEGEHSVVILTKVSRNFEETWPLIFRVFFERLEGRQFCVRSRRIPTVGDNVNTR